MKLTSIQKYHRSEKGKFALKKAFLKYIHKQRLELVKFLGNKCAYCGFSNIRALQIDHILGGGVKELSNGRNNEFYRFYNNHREEAKIKLQILCANCNWIKKSINNEVRKFE